MPDTPDELLTMPEVAVLLDVTVGQVHELVNTRRFPHVLDERGQRRVSRSVVEEYRATRKRRDQPLTPEVEHALAEHQRRIKEAQDEVEARVFAMNRDLVRWVDEDRHPAVAFVRLLGGSRRRVFDALKETRARLAEERARAQQ